MDNTSTTADIKPDSAEIGNPKEITGVLTEMFFTYVRSEDYVKMSPEDRNRLVNVVYKLIGLFS